MFLADRASGNLTGWANGGIGTPTARATVALPDKNMLILQTNGDAGSFSSNTVAAAGFGAGAQNDQAISMQVNAFMMAKANNVY